MCIISSYRSILAHYLLCMTLTSANVKYHVEKVNVYVAYTMLMIINNGVDDCVDNFDWTKQRVNFTDSKLYPPDVFMSPLLWL